MKADDEIAVSRESLQLFMKVMLVGLHAYGQVERAIVIQDVFPVQRMIHPATDDKGLTDFADAIQTINLLLRDLDEEE